MVMLSSFWGDKHEVCFVVIQLESVVAQALTSLLHDCIE